MSTSNFSSYNNIVGAPGSNSNANVGRLISELKNRMIAARVVDISLNSNSKIWKKTGKWGGIGTIQYQLMDQPTQTKDNINNDFSNLAKPLFPQLKNYPLVNEIVLLFLLPNTESSQTTTKSSYYYLNSVGIWNHPQQNGYPNVYSYNNKSDSQNKSYEEIEAGNVQRVSDEPNTINLNGLSGGTFSEDNQVNPLISFAGDNIFEGRFGNSIRLGNSSTVTGDIKNNWSQGSSNGSPITILRNGQPATSSAGWVPISENINEDLSSIYMTSTQQIPISASILTEDTQNTVPFGDMVNKTPISPSKYNNPQVIINSSRILFNTNADSIIASSKKNIILESVDDLGIKSRDKNVNIYSEKGYVSLGRKNAEESVLLGDRFIEQFIQLLNSLESLANALITEPQLAGTPQVASLIKTNIQSIKVNISGSNVLSNFVKVS